MECRAGCGACCIAPSIKGSFYGMAQGKPAGVRCVHLDEAQLCRLFGRPERPDFCAEFTAEAAVCGADQGEALRLIGWLEQQTN